MNRAVSIVVLLVAASLGALASPVEPTAGSRAFLPGSLPAYAPVTPPAAPDPNAALDLTEVLDSVDRHFPALLGAREQIAIAEGEWLAAQGAFDANLRAGVAAELLGFYQHELFDVDVTQATTLGGLEISGGYRLGQGDFAVWDKDLQTNTDGELRLGATLPLLRGRTIDDRRTDLWDARLERERAEPEVATRELAARRDAALAYWRWVAAGEKLEIAYSLLQLAESRQDTMEEAVKEGLLARIELADNERLIAERRAIFVQAERGLEKAAIALSLYVRDDAGRPLEPTAGRLPESFPAVSDELEAEGSGAADRDIATALAQRPELQDLALSREQLELALRKARNDLQPRLDLRVEASQDFGVAVNVPDDKGDFELAAGVRFTLPVQRRAARGAVAERSAELRQLDRKLELQRDKIALEVRDAISARNQAWRRIEEAERSVALARELEEAELFQVREGNSDLLRLNIRERQSAQASAFLVDVMQEYFEAWTRYQVVLGHAADPTRLIPGRHADDPTGSRRQS